MGLLGDSFDDPRTSAIMALSGGLLNGNFGAGLVGANNAYAQAQNDAMKRKYVDMQVQDMAQQAELRKQQAAALQRQQEMQNAFLFGGGLPGGGAPAAPSGGMGAGPAAPQGGGYIQPQGGAGGLIQQARQMGIPEQAIQADVAFNGGKGLSDMLFKRGTPNVEFINGVAVDKNRVTPGASLPQMSPTGQGYQIMPDPSAPGGFRVIMPQGADEVYGRFKAIDAGINAQMTPEKVFNPATGREEFRTRAQVLQGAQGPQQMPPAQGGLQGRFVGSPEPIMEAIQGIKDPQERANALAAFQEQAKRTPGFSQGGPFAAGMSTQEQIDKARALKQAEADVQPTEQRQGGIASGNYMLSVIDQAINHPGRETATGASGTFDPRNYLPGTNAKGFQSLLDQIRGGTFMQAYQNLKGGGQITEVEGKKAENAIARLNTAQSDEEFLKSLTELRQVVSNGLIRQKAGAQRGGATGSFDGDNSEMVKPTNVVPSLPKTAAKGTRARDTVTGDILEFNGMSWVKAK